MVKSSSCCPGNSPETPLYLLTAPIPPTLTARYNQTVGEGFQVVVHNVDFHLSASKLLLQVPTNYVLYYTHTHAIL